VAAVQRTAGAFLPPLAANPVSAESIVARRPSDAQRTLLTLQRRFGNQYVRRAVGRAGERNAGGDERLSPDLQRAPAADAPSGAGGCTTQPPARDHRAIFDSACLLAPELTGDARLNDAFHNNPPLTAKDNGTTVQRLQQALLDAGETLPKFGADGNWGSETTHAVASFQGRNGVAPGGFEAGRQTLGALDRHLQQNPPKPPVPPAPGGKATLDARCGADLQAGTLVVTGTGFPPGKVELSVDSIAGNAALADAAGALKGSVSADLKAGSHVVEASAGDVKAAAQFSTPCGGSGPPVDPELVTQDELLVLARYQFVGQTERDATEDAIRDLKGQLDPTPVPWQRALAETVALALLQFVYGQYEQLVRNAVKRAFPKGGSEDDIAVVDNAHDKASDLIQDKTAKDKLDKIFEEEDNEPTKTMERHLEAFRRGLLAELRAGYLLVQTDWIQRIRSNAKTARITPPQLQALASSIEEAGKKMYDVRYSKVLEMWGSYLARRKLGSSKEPGKKTPDHATNLRQVGDNAPEDVPGVLLIGLIGGGGKKTMPDARTVGRGDETVHVNQKDVHIHGMSEEARKKFAQLKPELSQLNMPVVLRGEPRTGGLVAIGRDEDGLVLDAGSDTKGKAWLVAVGQIKRLDPQLSDPDLGAQAVYAEDLSATAIDKDIKGA
jgi:peptidoglycan hydrolase-like protein with peptidoglycan-binding domain